MKKKSLRLSLEKTKVAQLNNLSSIRGGVGQILKTKNSKKCSDDCDTGCDDDIDNEQC